MQLNKADKIAFNISDKLNNYFADRIDNISIFNTTEEPYTMFNISFKAYDYFIILFNYDRGRFGCTIDGGSAGITLKNSQKWYDTADMNVFLQDLQQQIELRIPDKFLEYHGWK